MTIYTKLATTADRLLKKYGVAGVLRTVTAGAYNPATGASTPGTADSPIRVMLLDPPRARFNEPNSQVLSGVKQVLMSAVGLSTGPKPGDMVIVGGVAWTVKSESEVAPAGVAVIYQMLASR